MDPRAYPTPDLGPRWCRECDCFTNHFTEEHVAAAVHTCAECDAVIEDPEAKLCVECARGNRVLEVKVYLYAYRVESINSGDGAAFAVWLRWGTEEGQSGWVDRDDVTPLICHGWLA